MTARRRVLGLLVWLPVLIYAVSIARQFFQVANTAIFISTDDAVANISYALATEGRYGFLSSPILAGMPRHDGLFSYGPFYFYIGAALTWLFGYHLVLLRAIHLVAMLAIAAIAGRWFRPFAFGSGGVLAAIGVLMAFERSHWPMVRPDSLVALLAVVFVVAAGMAIKSGRGWYWFAAGLAASCGAFTHLVAWALVPAAAVTVTAAVAADARERGEWRFFTLARPLAVLLAGGLTGAAAFYASFGFRIGDQLRFLADYQRYTGSMSGLSDPGGSFQALIQRHFEQAYWYLPYPMAYLVWLVLILSVAGVAIAIGMKPLPGRRDIMALLGPPTVVWVVYFGSLGVYNNFHSGYAILNQVMFVWCGVALMVSVLTAVELRWPSLGRASAAAIWVVSFAIGVGMVTVLAQRTNYRALEAEQRTPVDQYIDSVLDPVPARARAIGSVQFGIEHPKRIQLVQFWDALELLGKADPAVQQKLAPDYIIWSDSEAAGSTTALMQISGTPENADAEAKNSVGPWRVSQFFSQSRYQLLSLTNGPPYGTTRVYGWTAGMPALSHPLIGVYDLGTKQWRRGLGTPEALVTTPAAAAVVRGGSAKPAVQTVTTSAPAGLYLLRIDIAEATLGPGAALAVVASPTAELPADVAQPSSGVDVSPWFAGEDAVYLVYQHTGGPFFVSQFGTATPALGAITAAPVLRLTDYTEARREVPADTPLPAAQWTNAWPEISVTAGEYSVSVVGNNTLYGYQAYGPWITVRPGEKMRLRVPVTVTAGRGCLGVLDETDMRWLVPPERLSPEYEFTINDSRKVKPVLADCSGGPGAVVPLRATIGNGSYALWSTKGELYVDQLVRAFLSSQK